jgi:hypothetical protein
MAEGDGHGDDMLSPEEESMLEVREFGKSDRLNLEAKRERLQVLNSCIPTRADLQRELEGLQSSEGKGLLEMATVLHDELQGLISEEQKEKLATLRFNANDDDEDDDVEDDGQAQTPETKPTSLTHPAKSTNGIRSTIGIRIVDQPDALGFPGRCVVAACVPGSPAFFSGKIKPGDLITGVDDAEINMENYVKMIRGCDTPGTPIKLLIQRAGRRRPFAVHLMRAAYDSVAQRRKLFESLATLAQQAMHVCSQEKQEHEKPDHSSSVLHRDAVELMKVLEREKLSDEIVLQEQVQRKDRVLRQAQILIQEFLSNGRELLMSKGQTDEVGEGMDARQGAQGHAMPVPDVEQVQMLAAENFKASLEEIRKRSEEDKAVWQREREEMQREVNRLREEVVAAENGKASFAVGLQTESAFFEVHNGLMQHKLDVEQDRSETTDEIDSIRNRCQELSEANNDLTGRLKGMEEALLEEKALFLAACAREVALQEELKRKKIFAGRIKAMLCESAEEDEPIFKEQTQTARIEDVEKIEYTEAARAAAPPNILTGKRVVINSLVGKTELNGRTGTAVRFDDFEGRYSVELDVSPGEKCSSFMIKPCNLFRNWDFVIAKIKNICDLDDSSKELLRMSADANAEGKGGVESQSESERCDMHTHATQAVRGEKWGASGGGITDFVEKLLEGEAWGHENMVACAREVATNPLPRNIALPRSKSTEAYEEGLRSKYREKLNRGRTLLRSVGTTLKLLEQDKDWSSEEARYGEEELQIGEYL